ncbi:MAG: glycosyltransferase family 9 protein [Mycobacterium leprae]
MTSPGARVVVVRPDHLGDVLLTLPGVAALRRALPTARLAVAVPSAAAAAPGLCPHVADVHPVRFPPLGARGGDEWEPADLRAQARRLAGRFDLALMPRPDDPWSGALAAAAEIPVRIGFDLPRTRPFLSHALPGPDPSEHVVRHLPRVVARLAGRGALADPLPDPLPDPLAGTGPPPGLVVPTARDRRQADALLAAVGQPAPVVVHPGSGWPLKNWPPARWGRLAARLHRDSGSSPLVLASAAETDLVERVVEESRAAAVGFAGRLGLGALAAVHGRARVVIGTDSGAMHLAALVGAPTVTLFGPADSGVFAPLGHAARRVLTADLPCRPCGTLVDPPCGALTEPGCVTGVTVDDVVDAATSLRRE